MAQIVGMIILMLRMIGMIILMLGMMILMGQVAWHLVHGSWLMAHGQRRGWPSPGAQVRGGVGPDLVPSIRIIILVIQS